MTDTPAIQIGIELIPDLHTVIAEIDDGLWACRSAIDTALLDVADRLGVSKPFDVTLLPAVPRSNPLSVAVGGRSCRLPRSMLIDMALFRGTLGLAFYHPTGDLATLLTQCATKGDTDGVSSLLAAVVAHTIRRTAASLLNPGELEQQALGAGLDVDAGVVEALGLALRLGISIGDHEKLRDAVAEAPGGSALDVAEHVVGRLAPEEWEIVVHPRYLDNLADSISSNVHGGFPELHEALFTELGIRLPRLTLLEDASLPQLGFAFVMGGIRTPPFIGLPPDAVLATGEFGWPTDAIHPLSGSPAAVVPADALPDLAMDDVTGPLGLMAGALWRVACDHVASTITVTNTADELTLLEQAAPMLAEAGRPHLYALTRLRRSLAKERIRIRDLRSVVQAVLDQKVRAGELPAEADLLREVRLALRSVVTATATRGASSLIARRLPPDVEAALHEDSRGAREITMFAARVVDEDGPGVTLVTSAEVRQAVQSLVAEEFPELPVVAEDELVPEAKVNWSSATLPTQDL